MNTTTSTLSPELEKQVRRRVGMRFGFLVHATVFVLVNAGLLLAGKSGVFLGLPTGGWIIGLLAHGAVIQFAPFGDGIRARMIDKERQRVMGR